MHIVDKLYFAAYSAIIIGPLLMYVHKRTGKMWIGKGAFIISIVGGGIMLVITVIGVVYRLFR